MKNLIKIPAALRHRSFSWMWFGLIISYTGTMMQNASVLWHLRTLTSEPIAVSVIGLSRFLAILLLAPIGGVVADSFNRRKILFVTQAVMILTSFTLGLLTWLGIVQLWHIYVLTFFMSAATSFDLPARQALIPNLVPREDYPSAFSIMAVASNTAGIAGPALGGLIIATLGQQYTYWFNSLSFLAVVVSLVMLGQVEQEVRPAVIGIRASLGSIREGVQFIFNQPMILSTMLMDFIATFFSSATTLLPFVARDMLHVGEIEYGWLASAEALGAVLTGAVLTQRTRLRRQGVIMLSAVACYGLATILFGLSRSVLLASAALMMVGGADSVSMIIRNIIRQSATPDYIRGRMVSINQVFFMGGPQLGEIEAGAVAHAFGVPFSIISGGIGCLVGLALVALKWPQLRRYDPADIVKA